MNPNICTICETMFAKLMKARQVRINAAVQLANLRSHTRLSQTKTSEAISEVLDAFYDDCAEAIWNRDGLLNKTMGDAVMAIFNFPIRHENHPTQAVLAAQDIQKRWTQRLRSLGSAQEVGVGVGVDCGEGASASSDGPITTSHPSAPSSTAPRARNRLLPRAKSWRRRRFATECRPPLNKAPPRFTHRMDLMIR
jgi:hypothetical protein